MLVKVKCHDQCYCLFHFQELNRILSSQLKGSALEEDIDAAQLYVNQQVGLDISVEEESKPTEEVWKNSHSDEQDKKEDKAFDSLDGMKLYVI